MTIPAGADMCRFRYTFHIHLRASSFCPVVKCSSCLLMILRVHHACKIKKNWDHACLEKYRLCRPCEHPRTCLGCSQGGILFFSSQFWRIAGFGRALIFSWPNFSQLKIGRDIDGVKPTVSGDFQSFLSAELFVQITQKERQSTTSPQTPTEEAFLFPALPCRWKLCPIYRFLSLVCDEKKRPICEARATSYLIVEAACREDKMTAFDSFFEDQTCGRFTATLCRP